MSARRRRHRGSRSAVARGWLLIGLALLLLANLVGVGVALKLEEKTLDRSSGCPTDGYSDATAVLIDLTDAITPVQAAALRNTLRKIRDDVPRYGRLEIYPLHPTENSALPALFAACSPGSGRDVDSRLYGNPELADKIWRERFATEVDAVIKQLEDAVPQESSPIFEGIQSVAVTSFGTPLGERVSRKRLVLISDMIHHTPQLSVYQGAPEVRTFRETPYYARTKPMLRGANVDVFLIVRDTRRDVQSPALYRFWVEYFQSAEGYLRNWEPLQ